MGELKRVVNFNQAAKMREVDEQIQKQVDKKSKMYAGDFKRFETYCQTKGLEVSFDSLRAYLLDTIQEGFKLSTFNRRAAGVKHFLVNELGQSETDEQAKSVAFLRQIYNDVEFAEQKLVRGQAAQPKDEVLHLIEKLDTRAKAISLFNLVTACRPSEMVLIKVDHIDLSNRSVNVFMKKQKEWHNKRLTLECVNALKSYFKKYGLKKDDYLVGEVNKGGRYISKQISDTAYRKSIHNWLGFAPYTLRKTQVSSMHEAGADLATIAKQSGHKNLETINKHYLSVNDRTVDKFL
ncbi:MAG: site-specific integrase [Kurthia sp.]|nr:site-specific integrase [Candidatus Kurthia equi]